VHATPDRLRLAEAIAAACRRLHARGLLAGGEGNISVRLSGGALLVTPSGVDKATISAADILLLHRHADGTEHHIRVGEGVAPANGGDIGARPSSELGMHRACYAARADVHALVHAHPPAATGLATAGRSLPADVLPELPVVVGPVALVPYARPGSPALGQAMTPFLAAHEVFLLANHGVTAVGATLADALIRLETVEQAARIVVIASLLGGPTRLPAGEAASLAALFSRRASGPNE
jgi:L-fuculose-phosphate aldolase